MKLKWWIDDIDVSELSIGSRLRGNDGLKATDQETVVPAKAGIYAEFDSSIALNAA